MKSKDIILFDGICILCNGFVNLIIRFDSKERFVFSSLQSDYAKKVLKIEPAEEKYFDTLYLITKGDRYEKSLAVLKILTALPNLWKVCYIFYVLPKFIRDFIYDFIARRRYSFFGKKDNCTVPSENLKHRFLD